jgi:hypothetical protein
MENPFTTKTITQYDEYSGDEIIIDRMNIWKYYKYIYFLCPLDTRICDSYESLLNKIIEEDTFNQLMDKMILYQTKTSILSNTVHFGNIFQVELKDVLKANKFNYKLEETIIVLPIYNISFLNLQKYIDNINNNNFDNLYDILILNNFFGDNNNSFSNKIKINNMINCLTEATYWMNTVNCKLNLTNKFNERKFLMSDISSQLNQTPSNEYIENMFNHKKFVDPSEIIKKNGFKIYNSVKDCIYKNDDINKLFNILDETQKIKLFNNMIISKQYCHLVINNENILNLMMPTIHANINFYKYIFGYAWIRFYMEECINTFKVKSTDMYIFTIDVACKLPVFYYDQNEYYMSPYSPLLVSEKATTPNINLGGVKIKLQDEIRITTLDEFKYRMNIFITGKNINIFEDMNFNELKMGITGSIMTACCQYSHPLMELFLNTNEIVSYNRFFAEYYYDSDIDTMIKTDSNSEFFDITRKFYKQLCININKIDPLATQEDTTYTIINNYYLFVNEQYIRDNICNSEYTYENIIENINCINIKKLFEPIAIKLHKEKCKEIDQELYPEIHNFSSEFLVIKIKKSYKKEEKEVKETELTQDDMEMMLDNDVDEYKCSEMDYIGYSNTYKVKISSKHLERPFEIFPINKDDFMKTVVKFHMPCVRAYYDGTTVYMTPSFISAHLTFMNLDYKYFAGSKDPINIINKYRMRGFGTWLNQNEIKTYLKYITEVPFWKKLYNINSKKQKNYKKCLGSLNANHTLFKPRIRCAHLITSNIKPVTDKYSVIYGNFNNTNEETYNHHKFNKNVVVKKVHIIDNITGYIKPLNPTFS